MTEIVRIQPSKASLPHRTPRATPWGEVVWRTTEYPSATRQHSTYSMPPVLDHKPYLETTRPLYPVWSTARPMPVVYGGVLHHYHETVPHLDRYRAPPRVPF